MFSKFEKKSIFLRLCLLFTNNRQKRCYLLQASQSMKPLPSGTVLNKTGCRLEGHIQMIFQETYNLCPVQQYANESTSVSF